MRPGNNLILGQIVNGGANLVQPWQARAMHTWVAGGTGVGKSKFLENCIRQDLLNWHNTHCGMLVLDPHGKLFDDLMAWLAWYPDLNLPVIPIDLRRTDTVLAYNVLRKRQASRSVVVDNLIKAIAHAWGEPGTANTPQFNQWAGNVLTPLYENGLTIADALYLIDNNYADIREALLASTRNELIAGDWARLRPHQIDDALGSTLRRFRRFATDRLELMYGQSHVSLDFGEVLREGKIVLVSLARAGAQVSKEDVRVFGSTLVTDLWTAAEEEVGKTDQVRPFYIYADEFQRFVTPDIAENLDEGRGFGLHLTIANQFPNQLLNDGTVAGRKIYDSVMENATTKVCFRMTHRPNLEPMAEWLFSGTFNPDEIKHVLYSPQVVRMKEEYRRAYSRADAEAEARGQARASGTGTSHGYSSGSGSVDGNGASGAEAVLSQLVDAGLQEDTARTAIEGWNQFHADNQFSGESDSSSEFQSSSESSSRSRSRMRGESDVPMLIPDIQMRLSHVQFRSLDEQLFRAMAVLFDQRERQCVARIGDRMQAPVSLFTPLVKKAYSDAPMVQQYTVAQISKWDFMLPLPVAQQKLEERREYMKQRFLEDARNSANAEATSMWDKPD